MPNSKKTIAFITHLPNLSGANQSLLELVKVLKTSSDIRPLVYLGKTGILADKLIEAGIDYKIIRYTNDIKGTNSKVRTVMKQFWNTLACRQLAADFTKEGVVLVHNNSFLVSVGMMAAQRAKIPYICHLRDFVWEDHQIVLEHPKRQERLLSQSHKAIAVSKAVAEKYRSLAPKQMTVIYDGVSTEDYMIPLSERAPLFSEQPIKFYIAGRIVPGKGQLDAVKAMALLRESGYQVELTVIGYPTDKSYFNDIQDYITSHHIDNVTLLDYADDLSALRREATIGLICSYNEALGRVTVENMLAGCVTIGANSGGTKELLGDNAYGLLYEAGNPDDLAQKIIQAIESPEEMAERRDRAQIFAQETFDNQHYLAQLMTVYREFL